MWHKWLKCRATKLCHFRLAMNELVEVNENLFICNLACLQNLDLKANNITLVIAGKQTNKQINKLLLFVF